MAPEILNDKFYNHKVDVWSLGVAVFEAIFRQPPFTGKDQAELIDNINNGISQIPSNIQVSKTCLDFLSKCLTFDPEKRITIDSALNHPFINPESPQYLEQIDIFHPREPQQIKNISKITTMVESRMFTSTQNEYLRAKFLKNACFLNIHEVQYIRCVPRPARQAIGRLDQNKNK